MVRRRMFKFGVKKYVVKWEFRKINFFAKKFGKCVILKSFFRTVFVEVFCKSVFDKGFCKSVFVKVFCKSVFVNEGVL